jgi:hypothetical protein
MMQAGDEVTYVGGKKERPGVVVNVLRGKRKGKVEVLLESDPFPVVVTKKDLVCGSLLGSVRSAKKAGSTGGTTQEEVRMPKSTPAQRREEVRSLRDTARTLGIEGADDMSRADLKDAIAAAKTTAAPAKGKATKTAKPTKKAAPRPKVSKEQAEKVRPPSEAKAEPAPKATKAAKSSKPAKAAKPAKAEAVEGEVANPFRKGSDRAFIYNLLVKGGTRQKMAEKAQAKIHLRPYSVDAGEPGLLDFDKRLTLVATVLRDEHGYEIVKTGRGLAGTLKVVPSGGAPAAEAPAAAPKTAKKAVAAKKGGKRKAA